MDDPHRRALQVFSVSLIQNENEWIVLEKRTSKELEKLGGICAIQKIGSLFD